MLYNMVILENVLHIIATTYTCFRFQN